MWVSVASHFFHPLSLLCIRKLSQMSERGRGRQTHRDRKREAEHVSENRDRQTETERERPNMCHKERERDRQTEVERCALLGPAIMLNCFCLPFWLLRMTRPADLTTILFESLFLEVYCNI